MTFLYWEECQSHDEALTRLRKVLREDQIDAEIEVIRFGRTKKRNSCGSQVPPRYWWTEWTFNHQQPLTMRCPAGLINWRMVASHLYPLTL